MSDLRKMVEEDGGREEVKKKPKEGVGGVSGREKTVKP